MRMTIMHFRVKLAERELKGKVTGSKWEEEEELWGGQRFFIESSYVMRQHLSLS